MYATPVVFPASLVPERWRWVLNLNPMSGLIEGFRSALLGRVSDLAALATSATLIVATFVVGVAYFDRVERHFADII
jgi:lipopolysaccharide transport system permease protein